MSKPAQQPQPSTPASTADQFPSHEEMLEAITQRCVYRSDAQRQAHIQYLTKGKPGETPMPGMLPERSR